MTGPLSTCLSISRCHNMKLLTVDPLTLDLNPETRNPEPSILFDNITPIDVSIFLHVRCRHRI